MTPACTIFKKTDCVKNSHQYLNYPFSDISGKRWVVDDVLQQVGPEVLELILRDGVPLADQTLLQQPGGLEQDVVDLAGL